MGLGVKADARPSGDRKRRGMADGGARVPEVMSENPVVKRRSEASPPAFFF